MSILNVEGLRVVKARMRGKETGSLTLNVNFTLCRREGLSLNKREVLNHRMHFSFDRVDTRKMLMLRL